MNYISTFIQYLYLLRIVVTASCISHKVPKLVRSVEGFLVFSFVSELQCINVLGF